MGAERPPFYRRQMMADPGTVTIPDEGMRVEEPLVLRRENSYTGIQFTLGPDWSGYLANTGGVPDNYDIYFTAKARYTEANSTNFFDVSCTVIDAPTGVIAANLTPADTDIAAGKVYWWQIQIRNTGGTIVKCPLTGKLVIEPRVRDVV
jgi:hypothetical protein